MEMVKVKKFKAQIETHRFRKNQDVWIRAERPNHLVVLHKWRGNGRYVQCYLAIYPSVTNDYINKIIGDLDNIKLIEVQKDFALKNELEIFD